MPPHATRRADLERACVQCGKTFWPYHDRSVFCSKPCFYASKRTLVSRTCDYCGAPFFAKASDVAKGNGRFCSRACVGIGANSDRRPISERFWERVDRSGSCWLWVRYLDRDGYGVFDPSHENRERRAHRWSWILANGPIPDGAIVCHTCDNPSCVNPSHLFLGTTQDNVSDKVSKMRHAHGSRVGGAKLTDDAVRELRTLRRGGWTLDALSERYGIHRASVSHIARGDTWKHVH